MAAKRNARRELSNVLVALGVVFVFAALGCGWLATWQPTPREKLFPVSGAVVEVKVREAGKGSRYVELELTDAGQPVHLRQVDFTPVYPAILRLKPGDHITALVEHDDLGRNIRWYREVRRGSETLLSYAQMAAWEALRNHRMKQIADAGAIAGLVTFLAGAAGRRLTAPPSVDAAPRL